MGEDTESTGLLAEVIASHGGLNTYQSIKTIKFALTLSGTLATIKGFPGHHHLNITINPQRPFVTLTGLPLSSTSHPDSSIWTLDTDHVSLTSTSPTSLTDIEPPEPLISIPKTRSTFSGHTLSTPWTEAQFAYFVSYAMWNYATAPFLWTRSGFATRELEKTVDNGMAMQVLEVTFPTEGEEGWVPMHTRVQRLYFDEEKLWLRKMEYVTDVAGGVTCHYCWDHKLVPVSVGGVGEGKDIKEEKGILMPMLRRVVRRDQPWGGTAVLIDIEAVELLSE